MKQRKVLIDLRYLNYLYNGFGQLSLSYGNFLADNPQLYSDLNIALFVPSSYVGKFGDKVNYLKVNKVYKFIPFLFPSFRII